MYEFVRDKCGHKFEILFLTQKDTATADPRNPMT